MDKEWNREPLKASVNQGDLWLSIWSDDHDGKCDQYALEVDWDGSVGWCMIESELSGFCKSADEIWLDETFTAFAVAWAERLAPAVLGNATWDGVCWREKPSIVADE